MDWLTLLLIALTLILIVVRFSIRKPKNFPPGPAAFPLVGSLPLLAMIKENTQHELAWAVSHQYGPVSGIFLGPWPVVIISGYQAIKHVLGREDLSYRPNILPLQSYFFNKRLGIFFRDGAEWREQRRFTLRHLRDFGYARHAMESVVHEATRVLLETLETYTSCDQLTSVDVGSVFPLTISNVVWQVMAGRSHLPTDANFQKILASNCSFFRHGDPLAITILYPLLQALSFKSSDFRKQLIEIQEVQKYITITVNEHVETYDENHMRDFIDIYIREMKSQTDSDGSFTEEQLICTCSDMFMAAVEVTGNTMKYEMRYLVQYPEIQQKLREEVYRVVGTERLPGMDDIPKLHYAQAVMNETLRHSGVLPFPVPRSTPTDNHILGYDVPKETLFLLNFWSINMDPELWGDPKNFRPERFIAEDGTFQKKEFNLPFGLGPRLCMGETVAKQTMILIFAAILQRFKFQVPPLAAPPSTQQIPGLITSPAPYLVTIKLAD